MTTPMFVWLGSGRARKRHVADDGRRLDQLAAAGLPVPPGAILLDEYYRFSLDKGLARSAGRRVTIPDAELWHNTLFLSVRLPGFARPVIVRGLGRGDAPRPDYPPVAFDDAALAAQSLEDHWSAFASDDARRDVLILESVAAANSGAAHSAAGDDADIILLDGRPDEPALRLPRLAGRDRPTTDQPPFARRLQQLLRGARRTLGPGDWRVEWADDGRVCWLTYVSSLPPSGG